jgi:hypothetical protein
MFGPDTAQCCCASYLGRPKPQRLEAWKECNGLFLPGHSQVLLTLQLETEFGFHEHEIDPRPTRLSMASVGRVDVLPCVYLD